jgi:hypothetical protein
MVMAFTPLAGAITAMAPLVLRIEIGLVMVTGPKSPELSTLMTPLAATALSWANWKVAHGLATPPQPATSDPPRDTQTDNEAAQRA